MLLADQESRLNAKSSLLNINRGFFDKAHPSELLGKSLNQWRIRLNYDLKSEVEGLESSTIQQVRADIYTEIIQRLQAGQLDDPHASKFTYRLIEYSDVKHRNQDRERIYLRIERETLRGTLTTVLFRVYKHGDYLYISADSYAIGALKFWSAAFHSLLLIIFFFALGLPAVASFFAMLASLSDPYTASLGLMGFFSGLGLGFLYWLYISTFWINVIKALFQSEGFLPSLRQGFYQDVTSNSFDVDDVLMFLKVLWPLIIGAIQAALAKNGIHLKTERDYLQEIAENSANQGITVNTGGGGIFGAIFGGSNNKVEA